MIRVGEYRDPTSVVDMTNRLDESGPGVVDVRRPALSEVLPKGLLHRTDQPLGEHRPGEVWPPNHARTCLSTRRRQEIRKPQPDQHACDLDRTGLANRCLSRQGFSQRVTVEIQIQSDHMYGVVLPARGKLGTRDEGESRREGLRDLCEPGDRVVVGERKHLNTPIDCALNQGSRGQDAVGSRAVAVKVDDRHERERSVVSGHSAHTCEPQRHTYHRGMRTRVSSRPHAVFHTHPIEGRVIEIQPKGKRPTFRYLAGLILSGERRFFWLVLVYGIAVSALSLALPLSVQVLVGTLANAALEQQVLVLAGVLLFLLLVAAMLSAAQVYVMELYERRFYSRIVSDAVLRLIYADAQSIERINREELMNRYFDVMTVQKSIPVLLTGGLATLLQMIAGIALTSFYHPLFMVFNLATLLLAWTIYRTFDPGAARSSLTLSNAKYQTAEWLETVARANRFFKSDRTIAFALKRTLEVRGDYIREHRRHFRFAFSQVVSFLILYAVSSAALLGVGGWLVIHGQLTIGQLVAAELVLAAVFYGLSRMGYYLEVYYDLYAALYKLSQLFDIEHEQVREDRITGEVSGNIAFEHVQLTLRAAVLHLDFAVNDGETVLFRSRSGAQIEAICDLLQNFRRPDHGLVKLDGHVVEDFSPHRLRDLVHVVDNALLPDCSIAAYLEIADPTISRSQMRDLLDVVGLDLSLPELTGGLDQELTPHGDPLSVIGVIKLKIAYALAARPRVMLLTPLFDSLSQESRRSVLTRLREHRETTVLCFSHRDDLDCFDRYLLLDFDSQDMFTSIGQLSTAYRTASERHTATERPSPEGRSDA